MNLTLLELKTYFKHLQADNNIKHFVFGFDEQSLRESIKTFSDYYLFVDYGQVSSSRDSMNRVKDVFEMAITIAYPMGSGSYTNDQLVEVQDNALTLIKSIRKSMLTGQHSAPWLKLLSNTHQILPFVAPDICRSIGWTLSFNLEGYDIFRIKS